MEYAFDILQRAFKESIPLAKKNWGELKQCFHPYILKKKEFLLQAGEMENYLYFVADGGIRAFVKNDEKEHNINFVFEGSFVSSFISFVKNTPSPFYLQAIEETYLLRISKDDYLRLCDTICEIERFSKRMIEGLYLQKAEREIDFLTLSASERYVKLMKENPNLVMRVSGKMLSSYLGILPESLSRIRKEITISN